MAIDLNDKTANGNTLTNHGATEYTSDFPFVLSTEAIALVAASSQYLEANNSSSLNITSDITIELWIKILSVPGSGIVYSFISKFASANLSYEFYYFNNSGTKELHLILSTDGSATEDKGVTCDLGTNTWHHVAVTWKASTKKYNFYLDGSLQGSEQTGVITSLFAGTSVVDVGRSVLVSNYTDAKMDEVRIWNIVRTGTEINNNKSIELTGSESNLVAYWPFESTLGTTTSTSTSTSTTTTSTSTSTTTTSTSTSTTTTSTSTSTSTTTTSTSTSTSTSTTTTYPYPFTIDDEGSLDSQERLSFSVNEERRQEH